MNEKVNGQNPHELSVETGVGLAIDILEIFI